MEWRQQEILYHGLVINLGSEVFEQYPHRAVSAWHGGVSKQRLRVELAVAVECHTTVSLADIHPFPAMGNGIDRGNEQQGGILALHLEFEPGIGVGCGALEMGGIDGRGIVEDAVEENRAGEDLCRKRQRGNHDKGDHR